MTDAAAIFEDLRARYSEPQRHYHTQRHIHDLIALRAQKLIPVTDEVTVELAIWFHDAIYDPRSTSNEEESAALAERTLTGALGLSEQRVARVATMILQTKRHLWTDGHGDTAAMLDLDLSILAAPAQRYDEYTRQVRAEYAHVPDAEFTRARRSIMTAFMQRPALYFTAYGQEHWEQAARANVARELATLGR